MSTNLAITIPKVHYVGFQKRDVDGLPLGFMTPDGTDKAAEKRKATVDKWAAGYSHYGNKQATLPAQTLENKPMVGFKLGILRAGGGRGWDSRNEAWRIQDPRGFELEITSGNLEQVMSLCTLEKGEILEECIWCRHGTSNVLVPTEHPLYKAATSNTERMGKTASVKDVKPGDRIVFKNGQQFRYLGRVFAYGYENERDLTDDEKAEDRRLHGYSTRYTAPLPTWEFKTFNSKAIHAYVNLNEKGQVGSTIYMRESLPLAEIHDDVALTIEEACDFINTKINKKNTSDYYDRLDVPGKWFQAKGYYGTRAKILSVSPEKFEDIEFKRELVCIGDEAEWQKVATGHASHSKKVLVEYQGTFGSGSYYPQWSHYSDMTGPLVFTQMGTNARYASEARLRLVKDEVLKNEFRVETFMQRATSSNYWGRNYAEPVYVNWPDATLADLKFYKLVAEYKSFSGAEMKYELTI